MPLDGGQMALLLLGLDLSLNVLWKGPVGPYSTVIEIILTSGLEFKIVCKLMLITTE